MKTELSPATLALLAVWTLALPLAGPRSLTAAAEVISKKGVASAPTSEAGLQTRVRERIYILRNHRVSSRTDEWAAAIRELVEIGRPALPELIYELDRTKRVATIRGLVFTLRAIGDVRAVPGLIRAIPKIKIWAGSDYGLSVLDPGLMAFMRKNQNHPERNPTMFLYGRPVNELRSALGKITRHEERLDDDDEDPGRPWTDWWSRHWREFATAEELKAVELSPRDRDLVEEAGLAKFGPIFSTGKAIVLGPVHEVQMHNSTYRNALSHVDFDTGRLYQEREGFRPADPEPDPGRAHMRWIRDKGIDAHCIQNMYGNDLHVWHVHDDRWNTLEAEIHSGRPLALGREATTWLVPFGKTERSFVSQKMGTFLFTTREGGRGILQTFPASHAKGTCRIRYRMWGDRRQTEPSAAAKLSSVDPEWEPEQVVTLASQGRGRPFLFRFESGEGIVPPDSVLPADDTRIGFFEDVNEKNELVDWCRAQGAEIAAQAISMPTPSFVPAFPKLAPANMKIHLVGVAGTVGLLVLPGSFETMSASNVRELAARWRDSGSVGFRYLKEPLEDTYVLRTSTGRLTLLQIQPPREDARSITFRYRLMKKRQ